MFSPRSKQRDVTMPRETREIDVLIGTDVISEGQNLQDCDYLINYDIHGNSVRIIQRFGRVDRIRLTERRHPARELLALGHLARRIHQPDVEGRMIADRTGDDNVLDPGGAEAAYRRETVRLRTMSSTSKTCAPANRSPTWAERLPHGGSGYIKQHGGDPHGHQMGLHAVIPADAGKGLPPGVIFALRNVNAPRTGVTGCTRTTSSISGRRAGARRSHRSQAPPRSLARALRLPSPMSSRPSTPKPSTGPMSRYSALTEAIRSMIDVTEERDVDSLFSPGHHTALVQTISPGSTTSS